jgi:signal transduction histidine kinase
VSALRRAVTGLRASARRHPRAADALLAAALFAATAPDVTDRGGDPLWLWIVQIALILPLVWRRAAPAVAFAAVALVAFVQWLTAEPFGGDAALLVALYTVAAHEPRRWTVGVAAGLLELGAVLATARWTGRDGAEAASFASLTAMVIAAAALGVYARMRREYVASLSDRAARLERARIARELHDIVAHSLSVMIALADGAGRAMRSDPTQAREAIGQVSQTGRQTLDEMRHLLGVLRDDRADADLRPQPGIAQLEELLDQVRDSGLATRLRLTGDPVVTSQGTQLTIYRLVQEALTNTLKHARAASAAEIHLHYGAGAIELEVTDDGSAVPVRSPVEGHGIAGMRERAAVHGAALEAGPRPGGGWRVHTRLPVEGADRP